MGVALFFQGFSKFNLSRLIENLPTSKIRSLAMGLVEVKGEVQKHKKLLHAPLTNLECVYYDMSIMRYQKKGKGSGWVTIRDDKAFNSFFIKDETGRVLIEPKNADVVLTPVCKHETGIGKPPLPEYLEAYAMQHQLPLKNFMGLPERLLFTEYVIRPAAELYVLGTAKTNPNVADVNRGKDVEDLIIGRDSDNMYQGIYYISDKPEKDVIRKVKMDGIVFIVIGAVMTVAIAGLLFLNFS